jgi:hypothetical protein
MKHLRSSAPFLPFPYKIGPKYSRRFVGPLLRYAAEQSASWQQKSMHVQLYSTIYQQLGLPEAQLSSHCQGRRNC